MGFREEKGQFIFALNPMLISHVLEPAIYAHMCTIVVNSMEGLYAKRLYEIIKDAKCRLSTQGNKQYVTDYFTVKDLKRLLGLSDKQAEFKYMKRDILNPALKEISNKSDCIIEINNFKREGKFIVGVSFSISDKDVKKGLPLFDIDDDRLKFMERSKSMGVSVPKSLLDGFNSEVLLSALDYTESQVALGKVKNIGAYLVEAIKSDFGKQLRENSAMEALMSRKAIIRERLAQCKSEAEGQLVSRVREFLDGLSDAAKHDLCKAFLASGEGKRFADANRLYANYSGTPSFFPVFLTSVGDKAQDIAGSMAFAEFCRQSQPACFEPAGEKLGKLTRELAEVTGKIDRLEFASK